MLRRLCTVAALVIGVAGPSGCQDRQRGGSVVAYVALGDSYTAAPLIGAPDGDDGCVRSINNYPHRLAEEHHLALDDLSCSGATSEHGEQPQQTPQGTLHDPQFSALSEGTELVTVRIGANDFNLIGRVVIDCVELTAREPEGSPCTDADAEAGDQGVRAALDDLVPRLVDYLDRVREKAPEAEVVVIGYPQIFPAEVACEQLPLDPADLPWARGLVEGINEALERAAAQTDTTFVDTYEATAGHDICGAEPWIAGATVPAGRSGQPWHPYPEEQALVAELVGDVVD